MDAAGFEVESLAQAATHSDGSTIDFLAGRARWDEVPEFVPRSRFGLGLGTGHDDGLGWREPGSPAG
jgi:hypothetical protein